MGATYRHPALKELKEQQSRFAPKERLLEQINRAETLLAEIEEEKRYPYEYLLYRITGFRTELTTAQVLDGAGVRSDLRRLVEDLSAAAGQSIEQAPEPVLTVEQASRRYNVSTRTITRWRGQGLVARWFLVGGRPKVGFLESSLTRFVEAHRDQVDRGTRFQRLSEEEREEIIRRARRMAPISQSGMIEIARRIARKMERSTETIRMNLKN
jgi:RNA polymerase primary sigma factor